MISLKNLAPLSLVFALVACGSPQPASDGGADARTSTDAASGTDSGSTDSGSRADSGMTSNDPCATGQSMATSTLGCNGGFSMGTPAANTPGGTCTGGGMTMPQGTCGANMECSADMGMMGVCFQACTPGSTYISTGGCPSGSRCFDLMGTGLCFLDCDATHACPNGMMCDGEGSCVPPQAMKAN